MRTLRHQQGFKAHESLSRCILLAEMVVQVVLSDEAEWAGRTPPFGKPLAEVLRARFSTGNQTVVVFGSTTNVDQFPWMDELFTGLFSVLIPAKVQWYSGYGQGWAMGGTQAKFRRMADEAGVPEARGWGIPLNVSGEQISLIHTDDNDRVARPTSNLNTRTVGLMLADAAVALHPGIGTVAEVSDVALNAKHYTQETIARTWLTKAVLIQGPVVEGSAAPDAWEWFMEFVRMQGSGGRTYMESLLKTWHRAHYAEHDSKKVGIEAGHKLLKWLDRGKAAYSATKECVLIACDVAKALLDGSLKFGELKQAIRDKLIQTQLPFTPNPRSNANS